mmetsp:Transcript_26329/g.36708  ORF Transcript_26329/g.36708 Transcript_26329/m.36708 type:complete len:580 (-) Transcript_26329:83-1822(-)|eukprot:CAMPEP_0184478194 /NCGR_PEP_ID=MMETSP0113_2-20130426/284_1 /TAXON_ID=91329 /ORGANISM="Norrisiella sphaerica, Strain BC52" /LENGTH=579 /DNA_ID=CAMNT_0026855893 /DNA_START=107 /DNA_END=1846 /DNA_ORIENTATION=+
MPAKSRIKACLGENLSKIQRAIVLVVGAGGIGCELLKNLVLTGFKHIELIDLDTIDLSNLNRQFLFRKEHIGMSKAEVARKSVLRFNPCCEIIAHHGNIKDPKFDASYFDKFDIVMNALDNLSARQHVNRMCLTTKKPLIESGTQGYLGQVTPIIPGTTACFECTPPPQQKTYAVCTIRSTPDKPVHCVVWAKHIFAVLFGPKDPDNMLCDLSVADIFDKEHSEDIKSETSGYRVNDPFEKRAFRKLFCNEVKKVLNEEKDWGNKKRPTPLDLDDILRSGKSQTSKEDGLHQDQEVLSLYDTTQQFLTSTRRFITECKDMIGSAVFDKDNDIAMDFISASANLRMHIYGIPCQSRFSVKGIAGNIIHAIATTNAIAAGLIVMEGIKVLTQETEGRLQPKSAWIRPDQNIVQFERTPKPSMNCVVCGNAQMTIIVDRKTFKFGKLYWVLENELGMNEPGIDILDGSYYGTKEENDTKVLEKRLDKLSKIMNGSQLSIEDQTQDFSFNLLVSFDDLDDKEHPSGYILTTNEAELKKAKGKPNLERLKMDTEHERRSNKRKGQEASEDPAEKRAKLETIVLN